MGIMGGFFSSKKGGSIWLKKSTDMHGQEAPNFCKKKKIQLEGERNKKGDAAAISH